MPDVRLLRQFPDSALVRELERRERKAKAPKKPAKWKCRTCGAVFVGGQLGGAFAEYSLVWCDNCTSISQLRDDKTTGLMEPVTTTTKEPT